jgi:hypothetical protein
MRWFSRRGGAGGDIRSGHFDRCPHMFDFLPVFFIACYQVAAHIRLHLVELENKMLEPMANRKISSRQSVALMNDFV